MINLTPHAIVLRTAQGDEVFPPSGQVARVSMIEDIMDGVTLCGAPMVRMQAGEVTGLPSVMRRTEWCIVSRMVLDALPEGSPNVVAPDTGPTAIRDDKGTIVAVTRWIIR